MADYPGSRKMMNAVRFDPSKYGMERYTSSPGVTEIDPPLT